MVVHTWAQYSSCLSDEINRKQRFGQKLQWFRREQGCRSLRTDAIMGNGAKDVRMRSGRVNPAEPSLAAVTVRVVDIVIEEHRPAHLPVAMVGKETRRMLKNRLLATVAIPVLSVAMLAKPVGASTIGMGESQSQTRQAEEALIQLAQA
ncbi:MAG: hypothetical protein ACK4Z3_16420, partial [Rhizobium rosettiformans]